MLSMASFILDFVEMKNRLDLTCAKIVLTLIGRDMLEAIINRYNICLFCISVPSLPTIKRLWLC